MKRKDSGGERMSRREFNRIAALGGTAAILPPLVSSGEQKGAAAPAAVPQAQADDDGLTPEERAEVTAKYESVLRKWGTRLSEAERQRVHEVIISHQRLLQPVRAFRVENSDPPATVLRFLTDNARSAYSTDAMNRKAGE